MTETGTKGYVMNKLSEMSDKIDTIGEKVDQVLQWAKVHDQKHVSLEKNMSDMNDDMWGVSGDEKGGVKGMVRTMWGRCQVVCNSSRVKDMAWDILADLLKAAIIGIVAWMVYIYALHPMR